MPEADIDASRPGLLLTAAATPALIQAGALMINNIAPGRRTVRAVRIGR
jgi:hypothetical protein